MDISQIDKNFAFNAIQETDIVWINALQAPISLHGRDGCSADCCPPNDLGFYRMAERIAPVLQNRLKPSKGE